MILKILRIPNKFENSKSEDLNETKIYNQFQLNDKIEINQNLYNSNKDHNRQSKVQGLKWNMAKNSCADVRLCTQEREKGGN